MTINFEYKDVSASERLEELAITKLSKIAYKYDFIVSTDVYFKRENTSEDDSGSICEIRVTVPGSTIFSESDNKTFEAAIAEAASEIQKQLRKKKSKMQTH